MNCAGSGTDERVCTCLLCASRREIKPSRAAAESSARWLLQTCLERDAATDHDQEWNWLLSHAATVAAWFGVK